MPWLLAGYDALKVSAARRLPYVDAVEGVELTLKK